MASYGDSFKGKAKKIAASAPPKKKITPKPRKK